MANTPKVLFRGAATTTLTTTLYTVPSGTTTIVTDIVVANTTNSAGNFTIALDGVEIASGIAIASRDSTVISLKQVLAATKTITGGAGATTINFSISGVEIS
jgi:hypothetical protein